MSFSGVQPINQAQWNSYLGPNASAVLASNPALNAQYTAYQTAVGAIPGAEKAATGQYNTQTANVQQSDLGNLNSRGLGRSLQGNLMSGSATPVSGYGSGALASLAASRQSGLANLQQGYTNQANELNNNLISTADNANNTYVQQNLQRQALQRAQNASDPLNPGNLLNSAFGIGGKVIPFL